MQFSKKKEWAFFVGVIAALCLMVQLRPKAGNADTFISPECAAYCEEIGMQYGICPELLEAIMESESSGNPNARNGNCKGLMQINENFHKKRMQKLGITDIYNERSNIMLAADYLAELFQEHGDLGTVLMIYNGSKNAEKRGEQADYTQYAQTIMKRSEQLERLHQK